MKPTQEQLRSTFKYDELTGVFTRAVDGENCGHNLNRPSAKAGDISGYIAPTGYAMVRVGTKTYRAHRLAWLYVYGEWPTEQIDHKDGNKANNAIANLRKATPSQNQQNKTSKSSRSNTGLLGVSFHAATRLYRAQIKYGGRPRWLGAFKTPEEASRAYWTAKVEHHECAPAMDAVAA